MDNASVFFVLSMCLLGLYVISFFYFNRVLLKSYAENKKLKEEIKGLKDELMSIRQAVKKVEPEPSIAANKTMEGILDYLKNVKPKAAQKKNEPLGVPVSYRQSEPEDDDSLLTQSVIRNMNALNMNMTFPDSHACCGSDSCSDSSSDCSCSDSSSDCSCSPDP